MYHDFNYEATLASSLRAAWQLDDVLREDEELDFSRNFMPESLARTAELETLTGDQRRVLNQIAAHQYLSIFGLVEEFILPFVLDHARPHLNGDDERVRALLNFAGEEAKLRALLPEALLLPLPGLLAPAALPADLLSVGARRDAEARLVSRASAPLAFGPRGRSAGPFLVSSSSPRRRRAL